MIHTWASDDGCIMSIFVSYAKEDRDIALAIYDGLRSRGLSAWIDLRSLLPGQAWEVEIRKAIRHSSIFLACLSTRSVRKRGYVQSELKRAVEVLETIPEGQVFVIPVRLDECEVPITLERLHWVDYFTPEGPTKLFEAVSSYVGVGEAHVEAILQFARIAIDSRNRYWEEMPLKKRRSSFGGGSRQDFTAEFVGAGVDPSFDITPLNTSTEPLKERRSPFGEGLRQHFTAKCWQKGTDPVFDITLLNTSTEPLVLKAIGVEVLKVVHVSYTSFGISEAVKIPLQDWYVLEMPELRREFWELLRERDWYVPKEVNRVISLNLPDPVYMEPKAPYRYGLHLDGYCSRMPNHALMRLWVNSNLGGHRSAQIEMVDDTFPRDS